jgi:hypothetical protein
MRTPTDAEMLVALASAACARQSLPPDVTRWAALRLITKSSLRERERARNVALRLAAEYIDGGHWAQAEALRDEARLIADEWTLHVHRPPAPTSLEARLVCALMFADVPTSRKQLLRILRGADD